MPKKKKIEEMLHDEVSDNITEVEKNDEIVESTEGESIEDSIDDDESVDVIIEIEDDDLVFDLKEEDIDEDVIKDESESDIVLSKHTIEGKHSLKYDSIFKGKKEENNDNEDFDTMFFNEKFEVDKASQYWF